MLVPRKPFAFASSGGAPSGTKGRTLWRRALAGLDQDFLTDNQLSAWVRRDGPGLKAFHFYPLPFPHTFSGGKWSFDDVMNHDCLRGNGPSLKVEAASTSIRFLPHCIEKRMRIPGGRILERCAVSGNTVLLEWETEGLPELALELSLPFYAASLSAHSSARNLSRSFVASVRDQVYLAVTVTGLQDLAAGVPASQVESAPQGFGLELRGRPSRRGRVVVAMGIAYDRKAALGAARAAAARPQALYRAAERTWEEYFAATVPYFECSNKDLERLYYYQAYVTRCNLYDIPFEPFTHPYTCPWKTGAVWQWSWNTPLDSVAERWLNDKALGAGGILLEGTNGGAPNVGSYLHPLERQTKLRDRREYLLAMTRYQVKLGSGYRLEAASTLPHTTPNGLLGAWEHYLCSQDPKQLRAFLDVMVEAEARFSSRELASGLYACYFVDEYDYSLRWKPYTRDFKKGDPQNMFRMETPVVAVDYNCYLYALRERIVEAAAILRDDLPRGLDVETLSASNRRLREAIGRHLWDESEGFFYDAHPDTLEKSGVKCIGAYASLYAGIASSAQAARMVAHLQNRHEFGTPFPCPSISMDTPGVDPSVITYGGDSMVTSGIWFTTVGLARYGYRDLVARYVARAVEMLSRGGPSSSYSYHSVTGAPNQGRHQLAAQSCIATDLICRYVVGIDPLPGGALRVDPVALGELGITALRFGPYRYGSKAVTVRFDARTGHRVEVLELEGTSGRRGAVRRQK